jgi:hypothetical protein
MDVIARRTSLPGNQGEYDVLAFVPLSPGAKIGTRTRIGRVVTDETRVWHGFDAEGRLVAAEPRKRDAVAAVVEAVSG